MKKYPPSPKKATAQTVASNNIIAYGIFRFHEGMPICRFHELSHTFTSLTQNDVPLEMLKGILGHGADIDTTGVYGHQLEGEDQRTAQLVDQSLRRYIPYK